MITCSPTTTCSALSTPIARRSLCVQQHARRVSIAGRHREKSFIRGDGVIVPLQFQETLAEAVERIRMVGVLVQHSVVGGDRLRDVALMVLVKSALEELC